MLRRTFLSTHLRVLHSSCRALQSTLAAQPEKTRNDWQPFNTSKVPSVPRVPRVPGGSSVPALYYDAAEIAMQKKRKIQLERALKKRKLVNPSINLREGTNEEVLQLEVEELLERSRLSLQQDETSEENQPNASKPFSREPPKQPPIDFGSEVELEIVELSSTGDGLALTSTKDHVVAVPFVAPGDKVLARVYKWLGSYSHADFLKVLEPSKEREGVTPECKYFADCGGCALQMISYDKQLAHKKTIVEKAFRLFSGLSPDQIPSVQDTIGSPLQYKYRTKLTPHFDGPGWKKPAKFESLPRIGFNRKNRREVLDIEHCPIGTDILQEGLKLERAKVAANYKNLLGGKTILLRESTRRDLDHTSKNQDNSSPVSQFDTTSEPTETTLGHGSDGSPELTLTFPGYKDRKTYTSDEMAFSTEYIGQHKFVNRAGSFFQNNNSILGPFTKYIWDNCKIPAASSSSSSSSSSTTTTTTTEPKPPSKPIKYLLDAYCGSGLFTVALSDLFTSALGIDIDTRSITAARMNATENRLANAGFIEADASDLFADVPFPCDQTLIVIDPPRKGASEDFLRQLCKFAPKRVVYVSCNVHTQARDVGMIVQGFGEGTGCRYEIESLRGFDFFPQTGHVEGVCLLNRVDTD